MKIYVLIISILLFISACNNPEEEGKNKKLTDEELVKQILTNEEITEEVIDEIPFKPILAESDSLALLALYNSTQGENWINKWDLTKPVSEWYGVELNKSDTAIHVAGLNLENNNLQGTFPEELLKLEHFDINKFALLENKIKFNGNHKLSMVYFDSAKYSKPDKFTAFVQLQNGLDIYKINDKNKKGKVIGHLKKDTKVTTLKEFNYPKEAYRKNKNGFSGTYIKILHESDTVLVFSTYLSSIPALITDDKKHSTFTYPSYDKLNEKIYSTSKSKFSTNITIENFIDSKISNEIISFDIDKFSFQEVYVYANNRFNFNFTYYYNDKFPYESRIEEMDNWRGDLELEGIVVNSYIKMNAGDEVLDIYLSEVHFGIQKLRIYTTETKRIIEFSTVYL